MSITIRREATIDAAGVDDVLRTAFGDQGDVIVALVSHLRRHASGRARLAWVAESHGAVVGFAMVTRNRLDTSQRTIDVGVLSPLAVGPAFQRSGVGRALVERAIADTDAAGLPALFLEGDPAYYARVGFDPAVPLSFRKPSLRIPDAAFQVVLLSGYQAWMTGTLVYAEPFWDHDCVGLRD
jgi:putative acetyltransferase